MNREDIIRMAREANFDEWYIKQLTVYLERFASLIASAAQAKEREACHALRQTLPNPYDHCQVSAHAYDMAIAAYGAAIRARGQA